MTPKGQFSMARDIASPLWSLLMAKGIDPT